MQPRHTVVLALIAVLLGGFIYFYEIRGGELREAAEAKTRRLVPALDVARVDRVEISLDDGRSASLERRGDAWWIVEPIEFPASASRVEALLDAAVALEREGRVDPGGDFEGFAVGDGSRLVVLSQAGERTELRLGRDTPVGANRYVRVDLEDTLDLVAAYRLSPLEPSLDDLRDRRVLPFETAAIERLTLRWPSGQAGETIEVAAERRDGAWRLTHPVEGPADGAVLDGLLSDLAYLRAEGFAADGVRAAFDRPAFSAVLEGAGPDGVRLEIVAAEPESEDAPTTRVRGRDGRVFEVAAERVAAWPRRVSAYRDRTLSRFDVAAARSFEMVFQAGPQAAADAAPVHIQGELVGGGWVTTPEPMAPDRAAALVELLSQLDADDIVADSIDEAGQAALGLRPPRVRLRVWGDGASGASAPLLADVAVGRLRPGLGLYAQRTGEEMVLLIDDALISEIPPDIEAFRAVFLDAGEDDGEIDGDDAVDLEAAELDGLEAPSI